MNELLMGFYCGLATLYPYGPVYCANEDCLHGACYDVYIYNSKSAPLPDNKKRCVWADSKAQSEGKNLAEFWYSWEPRFMADDRAKYVGRRVCFLSDRGEPHNINDLPRD